AGLVRRGARVRRELAARGALHGGSAVARQPARPVFVARGQRLLDEQATKAAAIDEQLTFDAFAARELHRIDETVGAPLHLDDLALVALHAARLGVRTQVRGIQRGVEMEGVLEPRQHAARIGIGACEAVHAAGHRRHAILGEVRGLAARVQLVPDLVELHGLDVDAKFAEGMQVAVPEARPVHELDAELERALGLADEIVLVEAEHRVEGVDGRNGGLAHADAAYLLGLYQTDAARTRTKRARKCRRRHPAGRTAADDDDLANTVIQGSPGNPRGHARRESLSP